MFYTSIQWEQNRDIDRIAEEKIASGELRPICSGVAEGIHKRAEGIRSKMADKTQLNVKARVYKEQFVAAWEDTAAETQTGRPIAALICPSAPTTGLPHDFNLYWGYTSLFNIVDYPSIILPVPETLVSDKEDAVHTTYKPLNTNPFDKPTSQLCKLLPFQAPESK